MHLLDNLNEASLPMNTVTGEVPGNSNVALTNNPADTRVSISPVRLGFDIFHLPSDTGEPADSYER